MTTATETEQVWLNTRELASRLRQPENTIRYWRMIGQGPPGARFGNRVLYRLDDVIAWENERLAADAAERRARRRAAS